MKKKIKIDIILPNYNSSDFIKDTLKSIISQTYKNWNLIIVDDCSNQKTRNILKKYQKNKKIIIHLLTQVTKHLDQKLQILLQQKSMILKDSYMIHQFALVQ